jgi:predicted CxxxxCH...CXXCH cytochrome family protein
MDPLVTNGTGTSGKHVRHFQERGIACERCHYNYQNAATHMNGAFDKGNPSVVNMNIVGPSGAWNAAAGRCSGVACHGSTPLLWYSTNTWTTPSTCTGCHASGFSSALDPVATNGTGTSGKHVKHFQERMIACERCHYQYPTGTAHANGLLDTPDPTVTITFFNIVGTNGSWINDTGGRTGQCANISCHGTDTLGWYGTGTWTLPASCTTCHSPTFSTQLDPVITNGSGLSGKHGRHVTGFNFTCTKCHMGYTAKMTHASGLMDTQDPSVLLVSLDATNPTGTWIGDTAAQTGTCSSLFCHSADADWYGLAGVTLPPCSVCHVNAIGARRPVLGANGDFGADANIISHHVTLGPGSDPLVDQCLVCHDMSMHMGGVVRVKHADTGAIIAYDPGSPSTLEPFCLSCHDAAGAANTFISGGTPASPFNDGSVLGSAPYAYASRINSSWTGTNGHGPNGNHATARKLTCLGNGGPGTGCHGSSGGINAHGSVNQVLAAQPFKYNNDYIYAAGDFALCFNCHANYPGYTKEDILGVKLNGILDWEYDLAPYGGRGPNGWAPPYTIPAVVTHFADHNETGGAYNDTSFWGGTDMNLHWSHIGLTISDFRGTGVWSGINCVNCHDVHGSPAPYGALYAEMGYANIFPDPTNRLGQMTDAAYSTNLLYYNPTYCAFNCHNVQGPTRAWYYPINE